MIEQQLQEFERTARERIEQAATAAELETVRAELLGRKGKLADLRADFGKLPKEERARGGKLLNQVIAVTEQFINERTSSFSAIELSTRLEQERVDLTLPAPGIRPGSIHPVAQVQHEIEQLFESLGFVVLDGPEVETEEHNFDALNIPRDHPARDMQDTFWLDDGHLLRTHTSPVQVRGMRTLGPPLRMIAPGRVFRNEEVDASHEHTFYQLEGMMVDRDVSVSHLLYFMRTLLAAVFRREVTVRLRPGFFPFVEPGFELDILCLICYGTGCAVCKHSGWLELLPCGLVHPSVLRMSNIDPDEWGGFAFGLGLTRLAMMRYAIDDVRLLMSGDLRFLNQF